MVPQVILQDPRPVSPANDTNVHPRPTLTVTNSTVTGPAGALIYVFEVLPTNTPPLRVLVSDKVLQGETQTSWTVPIDLPIGGWYVWRVHALDSASGAYSPHSYDMWFRVLSSRATLYTLAIDLPAPCFQTRFAIQASSTDSSAGGPFSVVDNYNLRLDSTIAGRTVSGSIGGTTSVPGYAVVISNARGSDLPAPLRGIVGDNGRIAGTFSGSVETRSSYGTSPQCSAPNIGWSLTPQSP